MTIAGRSVRLRFAGRSAADLLGAAFAHLDDDDDDPVLTLHAWDSASSQMPRPVFAPTEGTAAAESDFAGPGASYFYEHTQFQALHQPAPDVLSVLSARGDAGWFWMPDAARLPHWDLAAPFRHLLSWWLAAHDCQQVHGGAVGTPSGGVLLVGRGGSGKSTTALATLLDPRLRYAGDDYVALAGGALPAVHSLYCSGKVHGPDLERLPHLLPAVANSDRLANEKAVVYVDRAFPGRAIKGFPLRAIVMPHVTGRRLPRVVETTHAAALAALAPSTILQRRPPQPEALSALAAIVRRTRAFVLELGSDVSAVPDAILEVLDT